ncbi:MAG: zeta toxin family protein [Clostridia bacterium]
MKIQDILKEHGDIVKFSFNLERVNTECKNNIKDLILTGESIYSSQIKELVDDITENAKRKIILIAGPSSSGKTTTSILVKKALKKNNFNAIVVSLDDFFIERHNTPKNLDGTLDYESIHALDLTLFNNFINSLLINKQAFMPKYNFITGLRTMKTKPIILKKNTVLLIEGLHALNPLLITDHKEAIYKVYVCLNSNFYKDENVIIPAKKLRLMRRLLRDFHTRGHSISATLSLWTNVLKGEDVNIKPFKPFADFLIDSTHIYEPLLYATYLKPLLINSEQTPQVVELINMLDKCEPISNKIIPKNSLLWEFIPKHNFGF